MPRNYQRKTDRGCFPRDLMLEGVRLVMEDGQQIKPTARELGLNYKTLGRYVEKKRQNKDFEQESFGYSATHRRVFDDKQEEMLADCLRQASRIYFGLTMVEIRTLAFEFTVNNSITTPTNWKKKKMAGKDWAAEFYKRHPVFSLRPPEPPSLTRLTSFNKHNVGLFYNNLKDVIDKFKFTPDRIFNCDETVVTAVQQPQKKIVEKGAKRFGAVVSQEKGSLVTLCGTINAMGGFLPPFCVFPRVITQPLWEEVLPKGSKVEGHSKASGEMTEDNFLSYLKHFQQYARPTKEFPVLLLLDNHASHVSLAGINFCRDNNIVLLSFPPHCSHELQPLDKTVYGPFNTYFNQAADMWMRNPLNNEKVMTIHILPVFITQAFIKAFNPTNIRAGFESTGIQPLNRDRILEDCYIPSYVSDQPVKVIESSSPTSDQSVKIIESSSPTSDQPVKVIESSSPIKD
ncbi:uncharacterized protein LOC115218308 [Argonauta hians]